MLHGNVLHLRVLKSLARPGIDPGTSCTLSHHPNRLAMEATGFRWQKCWMMHLNYYSRVVIQCQDDGDEFTIHNFYLKN